MKSIYGKNIFWLLILFVFCLNIFAQHDSLKSRISQIIKEAGGTIGAAIGTYENPDALTFNNDIHYPMQSVFKFPLALAVLSDVDKGILSLDQKIHISKKDLLPDTWSPLREKYPNGNVDIALSEILTYTVSESDNNGCDILFRIEGGPSKVNKYIHSLGIKEINIAATEEDMHKDWDVQYKNWTTPSAMARLLTKFVRDSILSSTSRNFLRNIMAAAITGSGRIKGQLPAGTTVAHKTGSSGTNKKGIAAATNDAGIVTLPNGQDIIVVVFIKDSKDNEKKRDETIAKIARAAYDFYLK